jgi:hypothetical protein
MRAARSRLPLLRTAIGPILFLVAVAAGLGGCSSKGSYQLAWTFDPGVTIASGDCARRGVAGLQITGDNGGGQDVFVALCDAGSVVREVSTGSWSVTASPVDGRGRVQLQGGVPLVSTPPATVEVTGDHVTLTTPAVIVIPTLPECSDGVDNDGDGRVDLDDPTCNGDPNGTME